jgi:uncharacterized alkaline shock family protein YloU
VTGSNRAARGSYFSDDSRELVCGAAVDEILEQVADGHGAQLSEHQQHCAHCQAAIREFTTIWEPIRQLANEPVTVPQRLQASVMRQVDKLVHDIWYTLELTDDGAMRVAARVVATIARDTARRVPGVRVVLGRTTESRVADLVAKATRRHRHPNAGVGVLGRTAVIDLAVAVTSGEQVHQVAHEIQRRVKAELQENLGLQTIAVNVIVDDVLPRPENRPR